MTTKTYNPNTGKYDFMNNRYNSSYLWSPEKETTSNSLYQDTASEGNDMNIRRDYYDAVIFEENRANNDLIRKSQYYDPIGFSAYNYIHDLESKQKYQELLKLYDKEELKRYFNLSDENIKSWSEGVEKPSILSSIEDDELLTIGNEYINKAQTFYKDVVLPAKEQFKLKQEELLKDGTFEESLLHFSELPEEKQNEIKTTLKDRGIVYNDDNSYNNVFINSNFKKIFGEEAYKKTTFQDRERMLKEYSISSLLDDKFKEDPLMYRIQNLGTAEKIDLYNNSLFLKYNEAQKQEEKGEQQLQDVQKDFQRINYLTGEGESAGLYESWGRRFENSGWAAKLKSDPNNLGGSAFEKREQILSEYERKSNDTKIKDAQPVIDKLVDTYNNRLQEGKISREEIEEEFEKTFEEILPHYQVFKDDWELKDFDLLHKIKFLSTYKTLQDKDPLSAMQVVNDMMKKYIDDEQGVGAHTLYGAKNLAVGTVAELMNMANGVIGVGAMMGGTDAYADYMNSGWVKYWNDVSNYNTFLTENHKLYDDYGGISAWKGVVGPGNEYDIFTLNTLEEVTSMGKYVTSIMVASAIGGGAASVVGKNMLKLSGQALTNFLNTVNTINRGIIAGGMSHSMAKGTYDETYAMLLEQVYNRADYDLDKFAKDPTIQANALNEWLNSDVVVSELENTLKQAEKEWEKHNKLVGEKGGLKIDKNQYLNEIKNQFLNQAYEEGASNIENIIKDKYSNVIKEKHVNESIDKVREASARAAMIQMGTSWFKEFAASFLWNKWMIHKNARLKTNPDVTKGINLTATGAKAAKEAMTASDYLKILIKKSAEQFADEHIDAHTEHFSQGFGLQNFNNITNNMYNPESYLGSMNMLYNYWRPSTGLGAGIKSVADGFFDEAGIYEGLIGAISGVGGVNANIYNIAQEFTKEGRAKRAEEFKGKNILYKINHYLTNGIISDIVDEQQNIMQYKEYADVINNTIAKNKNILQDIHSLVSAHTDEEKAYAAHDEAAIKNAGTRVGFQLAMTLRDDVLKNIPQIQQKITDLKRFAEGNITQEDIEVHKKQMKGDSSIVISDEEAKNDLINNSKKLVDIISDTNEAYDTIENSKYGNTLSDATKQQLVFNRVYDSAIDKELNTLESLIQGKDSKYSKEKARVEAEFSSNAGLYEYKQARLENVEALERRKKSLEKALASAKRTKSKDKKHFIQSVQLDLEAVKRALKIEEDATLEYAGVIDKINSFDENEVDFVSENILSEEEIMSLNPEKRAQMLNPLFKDRYSKKQQVVIDNLIKRLRRENPKALDAIETSGQLYTNKRLNEDAYDRIILNADVYDGYVEYMQKSFYDRAAKAALNMSKRKIKDDLDNVKDEDLLQHLTNSSYSPELIGIYRKDNVIKGTERERVLKEAEQILTTIKTIGAVINSNNDEKTKASLKKLFSDAISTIPITTSKEFFNTLVEAFKNVEGDLAKKAEEVLKQVSKITNQMSVTSEKSQVDREQREQDNTTRVTEEQKQHKEAENTQQETKPDVQQLESTEEKPSNTESPTIQEQAKSIGVPVNVIQTDTTDEDNIINTSGNYVSIYSGYEVKPLIDEGKLIPKTGAEEKDRMSVFYKFLENRGIKLQDIIDFELAKILKKNPDTKVYFAMHSTNDSNFNNYMFAVVKYNDDVRSIHDESRGGTFTTLEGEKYLIIGAVGTDINKDTKSAVYKELNHRLVKQKINYTSDHSEIDYFWVSNDYTQIKQIQAGRRVKSTQDSEVKIRSISELLYGEDGNFNEESNLMHLGDPRNKRRGYSSLSWIIQKQNEYIPINTGSKRIIPLNSPSDNNGAVFLLIETADGSLLPTYINPTFYNEIKEGKLKDNINSLLMKLLSKNFEDRIKAKEELKQFLVLSEDNTFTIGKEGFNSISIKRNGSVFKTFNIDEGVNISEFLDAVKQASFRINITVSTLQTPGLISDYDEAGALTTDVSVLHTRNASFTMYRIDDEGKPIIDDTPSYQPTIRPNEERQIQYGNKRYREDSGVFKDELDNIVEDKELIKKLKFSQQVEKMEPSLQEKGFDYYIIDDNKDNPIVVAIGRTNNVVIANNEQALSIIDRVNKIAEAKAKAEAAQKELEAALAQAEEVDLGDLGFEESNIQQPTEQELVNNSTISDGVTQTQQTSSTETQKNINKAGNISLENFEDSNKMLTFGDIYLDVEKSIQLEDIFAEKGWEFGFPSQIEAFLKSKNVPVFGITNFESWLDIIKNCR